ncbi:hypothetical protein [uncultured Methylobacterium sp.]|uniref:hypothetical protein n=1 Tax=uncultured Methylobacterium sp. TaxID=157278 RepID=UPI002591F7CC|nr:hypothetical protein [uncultured Methylobacterium sp.]
MGADDLQNEFFRVLTFRDGQQVVSESVETEVAARTRFASAVDLCRTRDDTHGHQVELWKGSRLLAEWMTGSSE